MTGRLDVPAGSASSAASSKPRLLVVHSRYGWQTRLYFEALAEAFDVTLVTAMDDKPGDPMPPELAERMRRESLAMGGVRVRHYRAGDLLHAVRTLARASRGVDVILSSTQAPVHTKVAYAIATLCRTPFAVVVEQWRPRPGEGGARNLYNRLSRHIMRSATRCFAHGTYARNYSISVGVSPERAFVYPHMSADAREAISEEAFSWPGESGAVRFLFVGRLVPVKGLDVLLEAFGRVRAELPSATLTLVGDGELRAELEAHAARFGDSVRFTGWLASDEIPAAMLDSDVLVLPSRMDEHSYEGWGLVVSEAASLGRVLVVSDAVGSGPELVHNGENGFVVAHSDVAALAEAMHDVARDAGGLKAKGMRSRALFEAYNDPQRCVELLRGMLPSGGGGR